MNHKKQNFLPTKKHLCQFLFPMLCVGISAPALISTIAAHMAAKKELLEEQKRLLLENRAERMRANLLRAISHDLRSPLVGMINNSSFILEQWRYLSDAEKQRLISNIYEDSGWLLHMTENLLTVTRIRDDDHTLSINTSEEPVEEVISEALQKLSLRFPEAKISVQVPRELILLSMDAILIEQVIINLLTNAILHSQSTRPIELTVRNTSHAVTFTVRDYGRGLPPEIIASLFDDNLCASAHPNDNSKGTGLGLSICKTIVAAHHGALFGKNHTEGAEITFTLPKET